MMSKSDKRPAHSVDHTCTNNSKNRICVVLFVATISSRLRISEYTAAIPVQALMADIQQPLRWRDVFVDAMAVYAL